MADVITDCERTALADGLAAGLALALEGVDVTAPPGPVAAVPSSWVAADATVVEHRVARLEGISFVRRDGRRPGQDEDLLPFAVRLAAVRLGNTGRLTAHAVAHLSARSSGGEPTIRKQMVVGTVADLLTGLEAIRAQLRAARASIRTLAEMHDRITAMDWEAAKLLGASGFLAESPGRAAHVSGLTANCWVIREDAR